MALYKCYPFLYSVAPALLRQATYGTIKIGMYHGIKRIIVKNPKGRVVLLMLREFLHQFQRHTPVVLVLSFVPRCF